MKKALILVDVQKGFINKQSAWLPTKLANYIKSIIPIKVLIKEGGSD